MTDIQIRQQNHHPTTMIHHPIQIDHTDHAHVHIHRVVVVEHQHIHRSEGVSHDHVPIRGQTTKKKRFYFFYNEKKKNKQQTKPKQTKHLI